MVDSLGIIIENTPEIIKFLEDNGYKLSNFYSKDCPIIFTSPLFKTYGTIKDTEFDVKRYSGKGETLFGRKDLRGKIDLFKNYIENG